MLPANRRQNIINAMEKFERKNEPKVYDKKPANKKPEKITEKDCMAWMFSNGFNMNVVESKSTYSPTLQRFILSVIKAGVSDSFGNDKWGNAVFVEFKAKHCRAQLRPKQREFLVNKIETNCFALVTDNVFYLEACYRKWFTIREHSFHSARVFLSEQLPKRRKLQSTEGDIF